MPCHGPLVENTFRLDLFEVASLHDVFQSHRLPLRQLKRPTHFCRERYLGLCMISISNPGSKFANWFDEGDHASEVTHLLYAGRNF